MIVAYLLENSATFREAYNRLDNDHSVHLTIQDAPDPLRAGVGRNSFTLGADGKSGTILFNDVGLNMANFSLFSKDPGLKMDVHRRICYGTRDGSRERLAGQWGCQLQGRQSPRLHPQV